MHIIVLDSSLDHLIEIQKSFAFLTFTYTVFPHTLLSLIHTHACTHTKLTHTHTLEALCGMNAAWESDSKRKEALESELSL